MLAHRTRGGLDHVRQPPPAVMNLPRAVEMSEEFRHSAKADSDLDPIRDEPAFTQLIGD